MVLWRSTGEAGGGEWWIHMAGLVWATARTGLEDDRAAVESNTWTGVIFVPCRCLAASLAVRCILPVLWGLDHDEERRSHTKLIFRATDYLFCHPTVVYSSFRPALGVPSADFTTGGLSSDVSLNLRAELGVGGTLCKAAEQSQGL